jgi:hypothetical protein
MLLISTAFRLDNILAKDNTQDFSVLANDAVAAMREARRLAGARAGRVGYLDTSQGGWVAPWRPHALP